MHLLKLLTFSLLFLLSYQRSYSSANDADDNNFVSSNIGLIIAASLIVLNLIGIYFCYRNTQRLKREAQELRIQINNDYEKLKTRNQNELEPGMFQMNYYLVDPNDSRYQMR